MDLSDEDDNPYDFVAQYKKLKMERDQAKLLISSKETQSPENNEQKNNLPVVTSTITSQTKTLVDATPSTKTLVDATPSTSGLSSSVQDNHNRQRDLRQKKRNHKTVPENVIGPVICIGDFDDGYDMPPPKVAKKSTVEDEDIYDIDTLMANWRKKHEEEADDDEVPIEHLNRVMNVKVFWREMRTHVFHIRMSIESIYEYFAKLEDIDKTDVSLELHSMLLSPTDTPHSINLKIVDFIDGDMVFYRSPFDEPIVVLKEYLDKQDDIVTFNIKQKDVKRPIFMELKRTEKMVILYIKLSEKLGYDVDSFTLEFDGDKIQHSDTMEKLDLEGGECLELFKKK